MCRPYDFFCNIQKRRVQEAAPYGSAPAITCSAKPGAAVESHQPQFWNSQGPVARNKTVKANQILRAGNYAERLRRGPRNGVRGKQPMGLGGAVAHRMRPRWRFSQSIVTPGEAQRSGFAGKRRNKGAGAVFAVRRKRRQADSR